MKRFQLTLITDGKKWELETNDIVHLASQLMLKLVQINEELHEEEVANLRKQGVVDDDIPF